MSRQSQLRHPLEFDITRGFSAIVELVVDVRGLLGDGDVSVLRPIEFLKPLLSRAFTISVGLA